MTQMSSYGAINKLRTDVSPNHNNNPNPNLAPSFTTPYHFQDSLSFVESIRPHHSMVRHRPLYREERRRDSNMRDSRRNVASSHSSRLQRSRESPGVRVRSQTQSRDARRTVPGLGPCGVPAQLSIEKVTENCSLY